MRSVGKYKALSVPTTKMCGSDGIEVLKAKAEGIRIDYTGAQPGSGVRVDGEEWMLTSKEVGAVAVKSVVQDGPRLEVWFGRVGKAGRAAIGAVIYSVIKDGRRVCATVLEMRGSISRP